MFCVRRVAYIVHCVAFGILLLVFVVCMLIIGCGLACDVCCLLRIVCHCVFVVSISWFEFVYFVCVAYCLLCGVSCLRVLVCCVLRGLLFVDG